MHTLFSSKRLWAYGLVTGAFLALMTTAIPAPVFAQAATVDTKACTDSNGIPVSIQVQGSNCVPRDTAIFALIQEIIHFMSIGVGLIAAGGIIYGGLLYSWAKDNASQTKQAVDIIRNTILGLVIYVGLFAIANFLIPGGVFK